MTSAVLRGGAGSPGHHLGDIHRGSAYAGYEIPIGLVGHIRGIRSVDEIATITGS